MKEKLLKLRLLFTRYFYCGFDFEGWKKENQKRFMVKLFKNIYRTNKRFKS